MEFSAGDHRTKKLETDLPNDILFDALAAKNADIFTVKVGRFFTQEPMQRPLAAQVPSDVGCANSSSLGLPSPQIC